MSAARVQIYGSEGSGNKKVHDVSCLGACNAQKPPDLRCAHSLIHSPVMSLIQAEGYQTRIKDVLNIKGIPFDFINIAYDEEAKSYMKQKNHGKTELPQIFVNGEFKGIYADFDDAVETETLDQFLEL
ncbi:hypothetical protein BC937DRAFT_87747 [Endogone sp. FLAS-F59071]|nr:hypothetical protein BC937DRAFT_87747 [Endogone sp. FLAS-F59071]|eukprot:RUS19266.1 hypothetical protein BC937DRAFT_87747 [Endogone sp. FLAS-F59071]